MTEQKPFSELPTGDFTIAALPHRLLFKGPGGLVADEHLRLVTPIRDDVMCYTAAAPARPSDSTLQAISEALEPPAKEEKL